jgi:hypothetical protein
MKASVSTLAAIAALSLAVWAGLYVLMPATPPTSSDTVVIVGVCGALVLGVKWAWAKARGSR